MADSVDFFPKATSLIIHTGNIINWNRLKRKVALTPEQELLESLDESLSSCIAKLSGKPCMDTHVQCINANYIEQLPEDERDQIKLTVKFFMYSFQPAALKEAVNKTIDELRVSLIDSAILSFPKTDKEIVLEDMKPLWKSLEDMVVEKKISQLGVSDLNKEQLEALLDWAKVKPSVDQVNLASCCVMPLELTEFAKERDILLNTHSDSKLILPNTGLENTLNQHNCGNHSWNISWIVRYSALAKFRGVLMTKGYIIAASRENL